MCNLTHPRPGSVRSMRRLRRASLDTGKLLRRHIARELLGPPAVFLATWALSSAFPSVRVEVAPSLIAAVVTGGVAVVYAGGSFLWFLARADLAEQVDALSPAPGAVAAERERLRNLRSRIGLIRSDVLSLRDDIEHMQAAGEYWDPFRATLPFERLRESGGQLAEDPRTTPAYMTCSALDREVVRLRRLVQERWSDPDSELDPKYEVYRPPIQPEDDLNRMHKLIREAVKALDAAERALRD